MSVFFSIYTNNYETIKENSRRADTFKMVIVMLQRIHHNINVFSFLATVHTLIHNFKQRKLYTYNISVENFTVS